MSPTLEMSTSRAGRAGPMMLGLRLNTDREQDALGASVLPRRPARHTEHHDDDEQRAADFPGEAKYREVEIPIPHSDPYRVAAVISVDSIAAIDALRALLDDAETALAERYPTKDDPPAEPAPKADPPVELDPWGEPMHLAEVGEPPPAPIEPTPEQLEQAQELVRSGAWSPVPISVAEATANTLGVAMLRIAKAHAGCWRGDRCGICRELGPALALFQITRQLDPLSNGGEPA
jgi:hypothetical protein